MTTARKYWLVIFDGGLITSALMLAFAIIGRIRHFSRPSSETILLRCAIVVLVCQAAFYLCDLYDLRAVRRRSALIVNLCYALGGSCLVLALLYEFAPGLSPGRGVAAFAAPIILSGILGLRLLLASASTWQPSERVLVVGTAEDGITAVREIVAHPELNLKVVGFLDEKGERIGESLVNPGIIGAVADLESMVQRTNAERVVLSLAERRGRMPIQALLRLKFAGVQVEDAHSLYERITGRILLQRLSPSWLILSSGFKKSKLLVATKRFLDVVICLASLVVAVPVMALIALAIWAETGSPIMFRQRRIGLSEREFEILKFRSMYHQSQASASWTADNDSRITRVGRFIRKYRLDELPQIINILRGDMSLVGPRPEQPELCRLLDERIAYYGQRHTVRPGLTGWAQIKYHYGGSIEESKDKLEYDLFYIKHMSVPLDLGIIFETAKVVLLGLGSK